MKRLRWDALSEPEKRAALARPAQRRDVRVTDTVRAIFEEVEREGIVAVNRWAVDLDGAPAERLALTAEVVAQARTSLSDAELKALDAAIDNVRFYHEATAPKTIAVETAPGVLCRQTWRPLETCGLYVPAGSAPLVSTLIMLAIPALVAGVPQRVLVSPPSKSGETHPALIVAAAACEIEAIWRIGGAQAIAALTFGAGLPKADKIFGPGNAYVAEAKRYAAALPGGPMVDLPAGPSELLVVADGSADVAFVAADLLSQAEHDADAQVLLVSPSNDVLDAVEAEVERQLETLPRRAIARASLDQARFIKTRDVAEAIVVVNAYAPEHLSLVVSDGEAASADVRNAGAVFLGHNGAESYGDYVAGPSHVLPTDGAARSWSGVSTASFMKSLTIQQIDAEGVARVAGAAATLARLEGLEAHARAAEIRVAAPKAKSSEVVTRRRRAEVLRETRETRVEVTVDLDRRTPPFIATGVGFYDHMLQQVAQHGGVALSLTCKGDLEIDAHHTIEDCALTLGQALKQALGERRGIARYGFVLPMDEAEAKVSLDLGGRPYLVFEGTFAQAQLGDYPTEMTEHVFRSLAQSMGAAIHVSVTGENDHHKTEACFKAFGRALRQAIAIESQDLPSTKGVIA
ncbi:MAG: histidinol dehydrogenase [Hyphomonadaceae bacterium]|nr:histidinol dehydrogenase [Hyphomonadaceae bacterium]